MFCFVEWPFCLVLRCSVSRAAGTRATHELLGQEVPVVSAAACPALGSSFTMLTGWWGPKLFWPRVVHRAGCL